MDYGVKCDLEGEYIKILDTTGSTNYFSCDICKSQFFKINERYGIKNSFYCINCEDLLSFRSTDKIFHYKVKTIII